MDSPIVFDLHLANKHSLYMCYMPFLHGGGLFIPSPAVYALGDEVFLLLSLFDDPTKLAVAGRVAWLTPCLAQNQRKQGIGIQFRESEGKIKARMESLLSGEIEYANQTFTL